MPACFKPGGIPESRADPSYRRSPPASAPTCGALGRWPGAAVRSGTVAGETGPSTA